MQLFSSRKHLLLLLGTTVLLVVILLLFILVTSQKKVGTPGQDATNLPTSGPPTPTIIPLFIDAIPTTSQGASYFDLSSPQITSSKSEIARLVPYLPYRKTFTLSNKLIVTIVVPEEKLQESDWTLDVNIYDIDYQVPKDDEKTMKQSFKEAAGLLFSWMRQRGADPEKIIIIFGDRLFMQERAKEWLTTP